MKDQESTFASNFGRKFDDITPIDCLRPAKINYADYLPPRPTLSEADRVVVGRHLVRNMGGLHNIVGDRCLVKDLTPNGEVKFPKLNLTIPQLIHPLGERNILSQYEHDRARPEWAGVTGECLSPVGGQVLVSGVFGERSLSPESKQSALNDLSSLIYKQRLQNQWPSDGPDVAVGHNLMPLKTRSGIGARDVNFRVFPTMKELEIIREQAF